MPKLKKRTARYAFKISGKVRRFRTAKTARRAIGAALRAGRKIVRVAGRPYGTPACHSKKGSASRKHRARFRSRYPGGWPAVVRAERAEHRRQMKKRASKKRRSVRANGWRRRQAATMKRRSRRRSHRR